MSAFLPQHVSQSQQAERQKELSQKREIYQYNYTHIPALAVLDKLPIEDDFSFGWLEMVSKQVMKGIKNRCELEGDQKAREHHEKRHSKLVELFEKGEFCDSRNTGTRAGSASFLWKNRSAEDFSEDAGRFF